MSPWRGPYADGVDDEMCDECYGTGRVEVRPGADAKCPACNGRGWVAW